MTILIHAAGKTVYACTEVPRRVPEKEPRRHYFDWKIVDSK
jgi:hypothetical protein